MCKKIYVRIQFIIVIDAPDKFRLRRAGERGAFDRAAVGRDTAATVSVCSPTTAGVCREGPGRPRPVGADGRGAAAERTR